MGLGLGSKPIKNRKSTNTQQDLEQLVEEDEDEDWEDEILDADHVTMQIDPSNHHEESNDVKNISKKTTLRFHLKKRSKTVQGLLEKMFENELKDDDNNEESYL